MCCVPGDGYSLREYFCSGASREKKPSAAAAAASLGTQTPKAPAPAPPREMAMSTTGGFLLRRCGRGEVPGALRPAPETFPINKHRVDFGREDTCDVVLRHQHVSKVHAVFVLQTLPEGAGDMLLMQDNSSNGTWINGQRMTQGRFHQLQPGDRISFLQPSATLEEDVATWEVRRDPSVVVSAASPSATPALPTPAPAPKEAAKKVEEPSRAEQGKVPQDLKPASKSKKPGSAVEAVPAPRPPARATVPAVAPVAPASPPPDPPEPPPEPRPKTAKRKAAAAPPVAPKPMPVKRPAAPAEAEPPQKVRAAAKTQGKKPSRTSKPDDSRAALQQELAAGYAALAAAAAQAQAEEADEAEAEVPEPPDPPEPPAAPEAHQALAEPAWKASPPWRSTSMQMPPPPKSSPPEASPAASAAQAAGQVLSQMRLIRPKARPGSNGYSSGTPRITPYLDMPRSATPPPPPPKTSEEVTDGLASNDISSWARAWKLESYEAILLRNYDDVDQIVSLHCDDLWLFFKDNNVYDEADQWAFTHAIQGRHALTS